MKKRPGKPGRLRPEVRAQCPPTGGQVSVGRTKQTIRPCHTNSIAPPVGFGIWLPAAMPSRYRIVLYPLPWISIKMRESFNA